MGWGRTLFLGDIGNRLDIEDTERDITRLRNLQRGQVGRDANQDERLDALERENDELKLYLASLLRLLVSKGTLSPGELSSFVELIDREPQ